MTNMELASLIVYPLSSILGAGKVHKKKHKSKRKHYKERKKNKNMVSKFQSKSKPESILVHKLIKTEKEKEEEQEMDYDGLPSGDTWDEEDADQGYTSNKRSKIAHIKHTMSDSNSDKDNKNSTADKDTSSDEEHNFVKGSGAKESEFGSGYVNEGDLKEDDSDENKEGPELKSDSEETEEQESSGTMVNDDKDKPIGMKESEFGSGYVSENDVQDDDDSKNEKIKPKKKENFRKSD